MHNAVKDVEKLLALPEKENSKHTASHHRYWSERGAKAYNGFSRSETWQLIRVVAKEGGVSTREVSKTPTRLEFTLPPLEATRKLKQLLENPEYNFITTVLAKFTETNHVHDAIVVMEKFGTGLLVCGVVFYSGSERLIFAMEPT